jgi:hypothetical protein
MKWDPIVSRKDEVEGVRLRKVWKIVACVSIDLPSCDAL